MMTWIGRVISISFKNKEQPDIWEINKKRLLGFYYSMSGTTVPIYVIDEIRVISIASHSLLHCEKGYVSNVNV